MNVLIVEGYNSDRSVYIDALTDDGMQVEVALPSESRFRTEGIVQFSNPDGLVEKLRRNDCALLDVDTFSLTSGGTELFGRYWKAVEESDYDGRIVLTTAIPSPIWVPPLKGMSHPNTIILEQAFDGSKLYQALTKPRENLK